MEFFLELYKDLPKQGPGSDRITQKALSYIPEITKIKRILDAGCGSGRQTLVLAKNTDADIIALDVLDQQIEAFKKNINRYRLNQRVTIHRKSMEDLSFIEEPFDLIWSEGAIYFVGFEKGLRHFHQYLNKDSYVALTEVAWFTDNPDQKIRNFWQNRYPDIKTVKENISIIESCGYKPIHNFHVPSITWWTDYYAILAERINYYKQHPDLDDSAMQTLKETELEIDMFHKYSNQYGYEFFIMKKVDLSLDPPHHPRHRAGAQSPGTGACRGDGDPLHCRRQPPGGTGCGARHREEGESNVGKTRTERFPILNALTIFPGPPPALK